MTSSSNNRSPRAVSHEMLVMTPTVSHLHNLIPLDRVQSKNAVQVGPHPAITCNDRTKRNENVEKVGLGADLFAVTIPCCAKERCGRDTGDDESAAKNGVAVLLLSLAGSDSRRSPATAD